LEASPLAHTKRAHHSKAAGIKVESDAATSVHSAQDRQADPSSVPGSAPAVQFFNLFPGSRPPQRADRSGYGTLPTRAFRYCEAVCSAAAFGWHLFPPMDFKLVWDGGTDVQWTYEGAEGWYQLHKPAQFPGFAERFDASAPPEAEGFSPPFLSPLPEAGVVQIWTGAIARTAPGWNLLLRAPANVAHNLGYDHFEGVVETDRWFGPLFTNVRLTRIGVPVNFAAGYPFLQVQPVHRSTLSDAVLDEFTVGEGTESLGPADWEAFGHTVVRPNTDPDRRRGAYAVVTRQRRKRGE
jgi:hypothetical protein